MERLPSFRSCYLCGTENPRGTGLVYYLDPAGDVVGEFTPADELCGYPGVLHGGLQSAFLDDVMYWAVAYRSATSSVTVSLTTRFLRTAELGQRFVLRAQAGEPSEREISCEGRLIDGRGQTVAEAQGVYRLHTREAFLEKILPWFDFRACSPSIVARFRGEGS